MKKAILATAVLCAGFFSYGAVSGKASVQSPFDFSTFEGRRAYAVQKSLKGGGIFNMAVRAVARDPAYPFDAAGIYKDEYRQMTDYQHVECRMDFRFGALMVILYEDRENPVPGVSDRFRADMKVALLNFPFGPEDPGAGYFGSQTENHQIGYAVGGYLAAHLYPDDTFTQSGMTGRELQAVYKQRVIRWLDLRFKSGFSEWNSTTYGAIVARALFGLLQCAPDEEVIRKTEMVLHTFVLDLAVNSRAGMQFVTQGRSYKGAKQRYHDQRSKGLLWTLLGEGEVSPDSIIAMCPRYTLPEVLQELASGYADGPFLNKQRTGFNVADAPKYGIGYKDPFDLHTLTSMEAYLHPLTATGFMDMLTEWDLWETFGHGDFGMYRPLLEGMKQAGSLVPFAERYEYDVSRNCREEVNTYTYRTPDYMLSSAQDYKKGTGGDQQHIWQASIGHESVCFTTHPADYTSTSSTTPGFWVGSGYLPRAAQVENVAMIIYNAKPPFATDPVLDGGNLVGFTPGPEGDWVEGELEGVLIKNTLPYTHAWFPRDKFDDIQEEAGWVFGRDGSGYIAFHSQHPYVWRSADDADVLNGNVPSENIGREMVVNGRQNIYICEMAGASDYESFSAFKTAVLNAPLAFDGLSVMYESPSQGVLRFGWEGSLTQDGKTVSLTDYPRYANPGITTAGYPCEVMQVDYNGKTLHMDYRTGALTIKSPEAE